MTFVWGSIREWSQIRTVRALQCASSAGYFRNDASQDMGTASAKAGPSVSRLHRGAAEMVSAERSMKRVCVAPAPAVQLESGAVFTFEPARPCRLIKMHARIGCDLVLEELVIEGDSWRARLRNAQPYPQTVHVAAIVEIEESQEG